MLAAQLVPTSAETATAIATSKRLTWFSITCKRWQVTDGPTCVLLNGSAINPDGFSCEPGEVSPGQSASSIITTNVTGVSGESVSARLCLDNENTGLMAPCKTVSVKIA